MAHLGRRLQVVLGALELEPLRVGEQRAGLHAQQRVVRDGVLAVRVVAVVGGEQRRADAPGDLDQLRVGPVLVGEAVVLQLDEEVVAAEDVLEPGGPPLGLRRSPASSAWRTTPPRQPVVAMSPSWWRSSSSQSSRGL